MSAESVCKPRGVGGVPPELFESSSAKVLVGTDWMRVLFLQYAISPDVLRPHVPRTFEIEAFDGSAWVTLVALTMDGFRAHPKAPWWSRPLGWIAEQRFFNVRTYVRQGDVSGAYFLWGWLSRPWGLPWTTAGLGLPCAFGCLEFDHPFAVGKLRGEVQARAGRFAYHGEVKSSRQGAPGAPGLLGRFALERYTGLFHHHGVTRRFETQHAPWTAVEVSVEVEEDKLVRTVFPWFSQARLVAAHYAPGVTDVWLSQPRAMQSKS